MTTHKIIGNVKFKREWEDLSIDIITTVEKNGEKHHVKTDLVQLFNDLKGKDVEIVIKTKDKATR